MIEVLYDISVVMAGIWFYKRAGKWWDSWVYYRWKQQTKYDDDPWTNY